MRTDKYLKAHLNAKVQRAILAVTLALSLFWWILPAQADIVEFLINPGFEEPFGNPPEWKANILSGSVPIAGRDTISARSGSYGAHISITGASTGHAYLEQVVSGLVPGATYTVSAWMRHVWDRTDKYRVYIEALGGGSPQVSPNSTTTYAKYTLTQTADANGQLRLRLHVEKFATTTSDKVCDGYFDDCSVSGEAGGPPNPPTGGSATAVSPNQITWGWTRAQGVTNEVYRAYDSPTDGALKWTSGVQATSYTETGLMANTLYGAGAASGNERYLATFLGTESEARLRLPARYTLAKAPSYDDTPPYDDVSIRCDCGETKTDCSPWQTITFTFNNAFGPGPANVGKFTYAWTNSPTWDGISGAQEWASGQTLVKQVGGEGSAFYLHLRSWNSDTPPAENPSTLTLGPYAVGSGGVTLPGICVRYHTSGIFDGRTWETAFSRIQDAIDAAEPGDEIWVAGGTYKETIVLKDGIALYGGFAGTETRRDQRNPTLNATIIDGNGAGPVIEVPRNASPSTLIDGFTITNGRAITGGGIYCNQGACPTIVNNVISNNWADFEGGGIYCNTGSAPIIATNRIVNNGAVTAGGGVRITTGAATIANNLISGNSAQIGGGLCLGDSTTASSEKIRNNTIFGNSATQGGGIYLFALSSASVCNNIIAYNSSGILKQSGSGTPQLRKNCVYGNARYDYSGISRGSTDILQDPQLASTIYGNLHIQPSSPCRNAGNNTDAIPDYTDIDSQPRIQGGVVDIGADESDGTVWNISPRIVRVSTSGNDSNNGATWATAKRSIQAAIDSVAEAGGGEVWVAAGTYTECIRLRDHVYVYGGFAGVETQASDRNPSANVTVIDGSSQGSVVTALLLGYRLSAIDGFTIRGGESWNGAGVFVSNASPIIASNTITANTASGDGGGIYLANSLALVKANQITNNRALGYGGGVFCWQSSAEVCRNNIQANSSAINGCGVYSSRNDSTKLENNQIVRNVRYGNVGTVWGSGVSVDSYSDLRMVCNTIAENSGANGSVYVGVYGYTSMFSNIVSFNSSGIVRDTNATTNQVATFTGDPLFVNRASADYRLRSGSPCIDAGDPVTAPSEDYLGHSRPVDGNGDGVALPDIGCYEYGAGEPQPPEPPLSASATPAVICAGEASVLHAEGGSGTTLRWLKDSCDGPTVGTGNDLVVYPTATTAYYARWETSLGISTCASTTVEIIGVAPTASAGGPQTIPPFGTTRPLGGNTPEPPATGEWSVVSGGTGTFSDKTDPNATFTHTGGDGPIVLRWTVSKPPCAPAHADVVITIGYQCLQNGDFEGNFTNGVADGWIKVTPESGTWAMETTIKHSGNASQKITDASGGPAYTSWIYQTVEVRPNKPYVPTMWIYRLNSAVARIGIDPNGGTNFIASDAIPPSNQWIYRVDDVFISGSSGRISIGLSAGYQTNSGTVYFDDVAIKPLAPQFSSGSTTIFAGQSTVITAGGGFEGAPEELHWYTGPNGTGEFVGTGTSIEVSPTVTTTYYPRWEVGGLCSTSDDGPPVTVTVVSPPAPEILAIQPALGTTAQSEVAVEISGDNFISATTVSLKRDDDGVIPGHNVVVQNAARITCSFDLRGARIGLWDVVVANPDGQADVLANAFGIALPADTPTAGITIKSLLDAAARFASLNRRFCVWGRAEVVDSSFLLLDDGSGIKMRVFAPGHSGISTGDFVSAIGSVDVTVFPPVLISSPELLKRY